MEEKDSEVVLLLDASWLNSSGRESDSILMSDGVVSVSRTSMPSGKQNRRFCCCCCCCCWRSGLGSLISGVSKGGGGMFSSIVMNSISTS